MRDWQPLLGLPLWVWLFVMPAALCALCLLRPDPMRRVLRPFWAVLDRLYVVSGVIAAMFMVVILGLIVGGMVARWIGVQFAGSTEFAGYAMAATSFFALAYAFTRGAHIRVSILLNANAFLKFWLDAFAMLVAAVTATYFARFAVKTNQFSVLLNERTQGMDQVPDTVLSFFALFKTPPDQWAEVWGKATGEWVFTPVWLPQLPMSIGAILLAVCIWDYLTRLLANRQSAIVSEGVE